MGACVTKQRDAPISKELPGMAAKNIGTRKRRLSMSMEEDEEPTRPEPDHTPLCDSPVNACAVLTEAGIEFDAPKTNQDAVYIDQDRALYAVLDGHGRNGHLCSAFCTQHMKVVFDKLWETERCFTASSVRRSLAMVNSRLKEQGTIDCRFSGTTVTCCAVLPDCIVTAWLGDSRAIMGRRNPSSEGSVNVVELSKDHKPDNPLERKRILKAGGRIRQIVDEDGNKTGGLRIFVPSQEIPGVNFSRSMGDEVIHAFGVSSEVDCIVTPRTARDSFVVVASDGIFEFLENLEVLQIVARSRTVHEAATSLVAVAKERWIAEESSSDDITVAVIKLGESQPGMA